MPPSIATKKIAQKIIKSFLTRPFFVADLPTLLDVAAMAGSPWTSLTPSGLSPSSLSMFSSASTTKANNANTKKHKTRVYWPLVSILVSMLNTITFERCMSMALWSFKAQVFAQVLRKKNENLPWNRNWFQIFLVDPICCTIPCYDGVPWCALVIPWWTFLIIRTKNNSDSESLDLQDRQTAEKTSVAGKLKRLEEAPWEGGCASGL
jgi:hypothetical protein